MNSSLIMKMTAVNVLGKTQLFRDLGCSLPHVCLVPLFPWLRLESLLNKKPGRDGK